MNTGKEKELNHFRRSQPHIRQLSCAKLHNSQPKIKTIQSAKESR